MHEPIKIGIAGLGRAGWGMQIADLRSRTHHYQIVAGCDPIAERREMLQKEFGSRTYSTLSEMLLDAELELVSIASRSDDHYEHALLTLEAGKDILIEKPITQTYEEAKHLIARANELGRKIYVRHNRRFDPDFLQIQDIVKSGVLGDIFLIKLYRHQFQQRNDWQTLIEYGGGQLLNWGPHIIDHGLRLMEAPAKLVWSHLDIIQAAGDAEDHLKLILQGENNRIVDIEISGGMILTSPTYQIFGTRGSLFLTGSEIQMKYLNSQAELPQIDVDSGTPVQSFGATGTFKAAELNWVNENIAVQDQITIDFWHELYVSYREGTPFPIKNEEALQVVKVVDEAKQGTIFQVPVKLL